VITDRELNAQLAGAAGVRDVDLPALPEEFLGHLQADDVLGYLMRETDREPASVLAARQLVADAHEARTARRRPRRKLVVRAGVAVVAIAAAWTTAVAVTAETPVPRDGTATAPTEGISLVAAEAVTFPLTLDPAPEGLTPFFSRHGGAAPYDARPLVFTADYRSSADGYGDGFTLWLHSVDPRGLDGYFQPEDAPDEYDVTDSGTVTIDGSVAKFASGDYDGNSFANLLWERPDGRWVQILGDGSYGETDAVVAVAESLVDRPQPVGLQFGLAPAGWTVSGFEESRSLDLMRGDDSGQALRLSVIPRGGGATLDGVVDNGMPTAGPVVTVTVQGQEARLVLREGDEGYGDFWFLVGQIPDGPLFLMLAPEALTQEQVLQVAEHVTYAP
jgi:hypothetical protein